MKLSISILVLPREPEGRHEIPQIVPNLLDLVHVLAPLPVCRAAQSGIQVLNQGPSDVGIVIPRALLPPFSQ